MKQDAGLTEITGFLLILTLVILCAAVFTASALPEILEAEERKQHPFFASTIRTALSNTISSMKAEQYFRQEISCSRQQPERQKQLLSARTRQMT